MERKVKWPISKSLHMWICSQQCRKWSSETKKWGRSGFWRGGEAERAGGWHPGRKKEWKGRRVNITALCQANMGCWDTWTKSHRSYSREKELRNTWGGGWGDYRRREKAGKWKVKVADNQWLLNIHTFYCFKPETTKFISPFCEIISNKCLHQT